MKCRKIGNISLIHLEIAIQVCGNEEMVVCSKLNWWIEEDYKYIIVPSFIITAVALGLGYIA
jgi:hypothetical protein